MVWSTIITILYTTVLVLLGVGAYIIYLRRPDEFKNTALTTYLWNEFRVYAELYAFLHILFTYVAIIIFLFLTVNIARLIKTVRCDILTAVKSKTDRINAIIQLIDDPYIRNKISELSSRN